MAQVWLDLARYADTSGYHFDSPRYMWLWRDWVIKAFNQNMPFDQFTVEQLAGDLLPNATRDQQIASGFHRNIMTKDEGGADPDEYLDQICRRSCQHHRDRLAWHHAWVAPSATITNTTGFPRKNFTSSTPSSTTCRRKVSTAHELENPPPRMQVPTPAQETRMRQITNTALPAAEQLVKTREAEINIAQEKWEKEIAAKTNSFAEPAGLRQGLHSTTLSPSPQPPVQTFPKFTSTNPPPYGTGKIGRSFKFDGKGESLDAGQAAPSKRQMLSRSAHGQNSIRKVAPS